MGLFDNALQDAVPGGNLAKPIMIALGALLLKKVLTRDSAPEPRGAPPSSGTDGGLAGGLGDLISKFQKAGHGSTIDSWIGSGANQPIQPGQIGGALGQSTISDLAKQAGINEQDLLNGLAKALPGLVDKLTPNGRLPTAAELNMR